MEKIDWQKVIALRDHFLKDRITLDYWSDEESLALYDRFFAARIGWKWQSVWADAKVRNLLSGTSNLQIIDWGCGTGIATRVALQTLSPGQVTQVTLVDRSPKALRYAIDHLYNATPSSSAGDTLPTVSCVTHLDALPSPGPTLLLISHVLNELKPKQEDALVNLALLADAVIWVEPGAQHQSSRLSQCRNQIASSHHIAAPCTHQAVCPMVGDTDWCHHFAAIPNAIFRDSAWAHFAKNIGVDLHRLPYSFVASTKQAPSIPASDQQQRLVGQTRFYKGYAKAQFCGPQGLSTLQINARKRPSTFAAIESGDRYFGTADVF